MRAFETTADRRGYAEVLARMRGAAIRGMHDPLVRAWATRSTRHVPSGAQGALASALYRAVVRDVRYREDPRNVFAMVRDPDVTLREAAGNCIDQAALLAAALQYLGMHWRFSSQGRTPDDRWHVYVEALTEAGWLPLDTTLSEAQGGRLGARAPAPREWRHRMIATARRLRGSRYGGFWGNVWAGITGGVTDAEKERERERIAREAAATAQKAGSSTTMLAIGGAALAAFLLLRKK